MKNYVVGIISLFENDLKLFKVTSVSEYEAVKEAMLKFSNNDEYEIAWQNDKDYPKDYSELYSAYEEIPFNIIEI
jgi:hypothetical protein